MSKLDLVNLSKTYEDGKNSVKSISIDVKENEFLVLVGPSGCGKSTTLRMIAGLEEVSSGEIILNGNIINDSLPKNRNIAMVFQNYALYPHMSVFDNMAFSLKLNNIPKDIIKEKVQAVAESLEITDILNKKPSKISGGQKQRVSLGRAIIRDPEVFLMDEPLSNLDAKLRLNMRMEIIKLHKKLNTTFIYVTHDQIEAMTMGDRIAVMNEGRINQIDTPENVYQRPENLFVAEFIGSPKINTLKAELKGNYISVKIDKDEFSVLKSDYPNTDKLEDNTDLIFAFRPEDIEIVDENFHIESKVDIIENLGSEKYVYLENKLALKLPSSVILNDGESLKIRIKKEKFHLFNNKTGKRI